MNRSLVISISRKYIGLLLVTVGLLLAASGNTNYLANPTPKAGSEITFLTPKRPAPLPPATNTPGNASADTTSTNSSANPAESVTNDIQNANPVTTPAFVPATQSNAVVANITPPTVTRVPPPTVEIDMPHSPSERRCSSCTPSSFKPGARLNSCPQYIACAL